MAKFINNLPNSYYEILLKKMQFDENENAFINSEISCYNDRFYVSHGTDEKGNVIKSVYTDFLIEELYGQQPSYQNQRTYHELMNKFFGTKYAEALEKFCQENNLDYCNKIFFGQFEEEEDYYDDENEKD